MFKFIKNYRDRYNAPLVAQAEQEVQVAVDIEEKKQKSIVQEIHHAFYTEVDRILEEAKIPVPSNFENSEEIIAKADNLKSLGFQRTKDIVRANNLQSNIEDAHRKNTYKKILQDAVKYFSLNYPTYKFITTDSVINLCKKYNLIYGSVEYYRGEVPDKNIAEMLKFKIKPEDEAYISEGRMRNERKIVEDTYGNIHVFEMQKKRMSEDTAYRSHLYQLDDIRSMWKKAPLEIVAPVKDFDMRNMMIQDHKIMNAPAPKDPIVLQPVIFSTHKFYLIVTAWGDEASDPEVFNERSN